MALEEAPLLEITPPRGWMGLDLPELWRFRALVFSLAGRDIKLRYKQTALGPWWVLFQPLLSAGAFSFVFGKVAGLPGGAVPYFVLTYVGMMAWNLFSNALGRSSSSVVANGHLVSKVYFPRLIMPLSAVLTALIDVAVSAVPLVGFLLWYRINPGLAVLTVPLWMVLLMLLGTGLGLFLAAFMVHYRDVGYVVGVLTQILMLASPVAYTVGAVPSRYHTLYMLNPLAPLVEAFRWACLGSGDPQIAWLGYAAGAAILAFVSGWVAFRWMEAGFADVI